MRALFVYHIIFMWNERKKRKCFKNKFVNFLLHLFFSVVVFILFFSRKFCDYGHFSKRKKNRAKLIRWINGMSPRRKNISALYYLIHMFLLRFNTCKKCALNHKIKNRNSLWLIQIKKITVIINRDAMEPLPCNWKSHQMKSKQKTFQTKLDGFEICLHKTFIYLL